MQKIASNIFLNHIKKNLFHPNILRTGGRRKSLISSLTLVNKIFMSGPVNLSSAAKVKMFLSRHATRYFKYKLSLIFF